MHESHALHLSNSSLPKRGIFFYLTHFSSDRKQRVSVTCPPPYRNDYRGSSSFPFAVSCTFRTCLPLAYRAVESPCLVLVAYRLRSRRVSAQSRRDRARADAGAGVVQALSPKWRRRTWTATTPAICWPPPPPQQIMASTASVFGNQLAGL